MMTPFRPERRARTSRPLLETLEDRCVPAVSFLFDYSLDVNNFFDTQAKRDLLTMAGNVLTSRLADNLDAIVPSGSNTWTPSIFHPGTGASFNLAPNLIVPANVIIIYAGGHDITSGPLALGGPGGYSTLSGSSAWKNTVDSRGQAGALAGPPTDFAPAVGTITFDTAGPAWHFGATTTGISGKYDFLSVATHELGHVLGYGTSSSWNTYVSGSNFIGPASVAEYGSSVPLSSDKAHWAAGTVSNGSEAIMSPSIAAGVRKPITDLDFAGLDDIGWLVGTISPTLAPIGPKLTPENTPLSFTISASDPESPPEVLTYTATGLPAGATFDPATRTFNWTPTELQGPGVYQVTFTVSDGILEDSEVVTLTVTEQNEPPTLADIGPKSVGETQTLTFTISGSDTDLPAQGLTYSATDLPTGATFDPATRTFSWTTTESQAPFDYDIIFTVTDGGGLSDSETVRITVIETNSPPVLVPVDHVTTDEETLLSFSISADDPDDPPNTLTYSATGLPPGAAFDTATRTFSWTPTEAQGPGSHTVVFTVVDDGPGNLSDTKSVTIRVNEVNKPPRLNDVTNPTVDEGSLLTLTLSATDADQPANTLTYSAPQGLPLGATFDPATRTFSWTPTEAQGGSDYNVTFVVTDNGPGNLSDSKTVKIHVNEVNSPPILTPIPPRTVQVGTPLTFTLSGTDPDEPTNTLLFSAPAGLPADATFDATTRTFRWTPTAAGTFQVLFQATDGNLNDSELATITVLPNPTSSLGLNATATRPVTATLTRRRVGKKVRLFVELSYADTGEVKSVVLSPFQRERFAAIQASALDSDGDGVADAALVTGRRGKRQLSRVVTG